MAAAQPGAHVLTTTINVMPKLDDDLEFIPVHHSLCVTFLATEAARRCSWTRAGVELDEFICCLYVICIIHISVILHDTVGDYCFSPWPTIPVYYVCSY